tara:strand:- start:2684 stop:3577 length:894 start_codon:yes stop_codon:yes gene_type:complete
MSSNLHLLINKFHDYIKYEKQYSEHTIKNYLIDLTQFREKFDSVDLSSITTTSLQDYISSLHKMGLDTSTIARKKSTISSLFTFFCKKKIIDKNPCKKLISPKRRSKIPTVMSITEINKLCDIKEKTYQAIRDKAIIELMYSSALRLSETTSLNMSSIDLESKLLVVEGKGKKTRYLPVGDCALSAIKSWIKVRKEISDKNENALFLNKYGKRISNRSIQQRIIYWCKKKSLNYAINPHVLRHTCATHLLESSGDIRAVQEFLGHQDISTTQIYTSVNFDYIKKVYDKTHPRAKSSN